MTRKKTIAVLLLLAVCPPWVGAQVPAAEPYHLGSPSGWVVVDADADLRSATALESGDSDYLLVDRQVRLSSVTETYSRYVERMASQADVDRAAQVSLEFDPQHDRLLVHGVRVLRDGRAIDKLADARRALLNREEELERKLINGRVTLHLVLQDLRVGDVLDYSFTREHTDPFGERGYHDWFLMQWTTPVGRVRLRVLHPDGRNLRFGEHGTLPTRVQSKRSGWTETVWDNHDVAALPVEESRPGWHSYLPRVEVSEFQNWNAVRAWSRPMYVLQAGQIATLAPFIAELKTEPNEAKRLLRALRFVQDDIRYTGIEIGAGAYRPTQPGVVFARRFGDCKDKVLLLVTLLRELGVRAHPALVNTRLGRGIADRTPGPGAFDHVIARVRWKNREYWFDATASGQGGQWDTAVQADYGLALVLDDSSQGLVPMPRRPVSLPTQDVVETYDLRKGTRHTASFGVKTVYRDDEADAMRVKMLTQTVTALGKEYLEYYRKSHSGIRTARPLAVIDDRERNVFTVEESYQIDDPFEKNEEGEYKLQLEAFVISDRTGAPKQTLRHTPLARSYPLHVRQQILAYLPGNWNIDSSAVQISDPAFEYNSKAGFEAGRLTLLYELRHTADHVPVATLRQFLVNLAKVRADAFYTLTDGKDPVVTDNVAQSARAGASIEMILTLFVGLYLGVVASVKLAGLPYRLPSAKPGSPAGFGGWLILPIIGTVLSPFALGYAIWILWDSLGSAAVFSTRTHSMQWMVLAVFATTCAAWTLSFMTVWLLFRKAHSFVLAFVALQILGALIAGLGVGILWISGADTVETARQANQMVLHLLVSALWATYPLVSQRVRATFLMPWRVPPASASTAIA